MEKIILLILLLSLIVPLINAEDEEQSQSNFLQQLEENGEGTAENTMNNVPVTENSEADLRSGDTVSNGGKTVEGENPDTVVRKGNNKVIGKQKTHMNGDGMHIEFADQAISSKGAKANGVSNGHVSSNGWYNFGSVKSQLRFFQGFEWP